MKRLATLLVSIGLAAGGLFTVSTAIAPAAHAVGPCSVVGTSDKAATIKCTGPGQFRGYVTCRRTTNPNYGYVSYGPFVNSGGVSVARCGQSPNDYRTGQGWDFP
jgi:hypothetical protein